MSSATAVLPGVRRICFAGVSPGSPLSAVLSDVLPSPLANAEYSGGPAAVTKAWRREVSGTDVQWWDATAMAGSECGGSADVVVDLFGNDLSAARGKRVWRVVDSSGEAILNPFCLLETCCRAPFVASILLVEGTLGEAEWKVLAQAHISNRWRYRKLLNRIARIAAQLIAHAVLSLEEPQQELGSMVIRKRKRSAFQIAVERAGARFRAAAASARKAMFNEYWAIGVLEVPMRKLLRSGPLHADRWIQPSMPGAYFADPFPLPGRSDALLCERFDYAADCGTIQLLTLGRDDVQERTLDLHRSARHMSYPSLLEDVGRVLLLPEMASAGELVLYELREDGATRVLCTVDRGTRMADPTLFHNGEFYWIAYCNQAFGDCDNLCLLYARRPEGPWMPHPKNPVKIDVRSSRPAGALFSIDGKLLRPAQDCSQAYGGAVVVNEIVSCTPAAYEEREVVVITPDPRGPFPDGLHTVSLAADRIFIDGKKSFFDPKRFGKCVRDYARRRWLQVRAIQ